MADLSSIEHRKLEQLLRMSGGYVPDFSDRTFSEFFEEHTRRDIDAAVYRERGTSKANRMRGFWVVEGNHLVEPLGGVAGVSHGMPCACGTISRVQTRDAPCKGTGRQARAGNEQA